MKNTTLTIAAVPAGIVGILLLTEGVSAMNKPNDLLPNVSKEEAIVGGVLVAASVWALFEGFKR